MYPPHHVGLEEDQVGLRTLFRPHMEPINTRSSNSFVASFSHTSSISLVAGKEFEVLL